MNNLALKPMSEDPLKKQAIKERYYRNAKHIHLVLLGFTIVAFLAILLTVSVGSSRISFVDVCRAVRSKILPNFYPVQDEVAFNIVWELRMPRILIAVLCGAGLSVSGAVMQALTRNPLVSSFTVGISNAAAFGASAAILFGARFIGSGQLAITLGAAACAALCATLVYVISARRGLSPVSIVLSGTALTYLFSALTNTIQYVSSDDKLAAVVHWSFGSFSGATGTQVWILFAALALCFTVFLRNSWTLNAVASSSDEVSRGLGIDTARMRVILGLLCVLLTACAVSFCGVIGFVGIVGPHIARLIIGPDHKPLLPFSALFGAVLVLVADTVGRVLLSPVIIPVGIIVAYIGVPIFLQLILSKREVYFR